MRVRAPAAVPSTRNPPYSPSAQGAGLLKVRIYDFGLYVDAPTARRALPPGGGVPGLASASAAAGGRAALAPPPRLSHAVNAAGDVPLSLVVRAARNLPIFLVAREYEGALRRRLARVGALFYPFF